MKLHFTYTYIKTLEIEIKKYQTTNQVFLVCPSAGGILLLRISNYIQFCPKPQNLFINPPPSGLFNVVLEHHERELLSE